jgi:translation initiation factor 2 beta subunit (eIF-2beta)/eIF-5
MTTINIKQKINDMIYRYKMPKLQIRIEDMKMILANISAIGRALHRSPICM